MSKALVLGAAALVFSAAGTSAADLVAPGYGYASGSRTRVHGTTGLCSPGLRGAAGLPGTRHRL
jgi:hypothetical protein